MRQGGSTRNKMDVLHLRSCSLRFPQVFQCVFLISAVMILFGMASYGQDIRIRVLDGHNGKPITKECLNVWIGTGRGAHMIAATNKNGVVVLHLAENEIQAEIACPGWPARVIGHANNLQISGDEYLPCQEYGKINPGEPITPDLTMAPMPSYSIKKILESSVKGSNTCGKFRKEAKPGELIFYERPLHWWEKMRR